MPPPSVTRACDDDKSETEASCLKIAESGVYKLEGRCGLGVLQGIDHVEVAGGLEVDGRWS